MESFFFLLLWFGTLSKTRLVLSFLFYQPFSLLASQNKGSRKGVFFFLRSLKNKNMQWGGRW